MLPSNNKHCTMMVWVLKSLAFSREPLQNCLFIDMLDPYMREKFRLKRNAVIAQYHAFLRRFTLSNLKASAGNAVAFIFR